MTWQHKQTYRLAVFWPFDMPTHTRVEQPPNTPPYNCYDSPLHTILQLCNMHLPMQQEGGRQYRTSGRSATMAIPTAPREHAAAIPTMVNNQPKNKLSIARVSNIVEDTQSQIGPVPAGLTYMSIVASQIHALASIACLPWPTSCIVTSGPTTCKESRGWLLTRPRETQTCGPTTCIKAACGCPHAPVKPIHADLQLARPADTRHSDQQLVRHAEMRHSDQQLAMKPRVAAHTPAGVEVRGWAGDSQRTCSAIS